MNPLSADFDIEIWTKRDGILKHGDVKGSNDGKWAGKRFEINSGSDWFAWWQSLASLVEMRRV